MNDNKSRVWNSLRMGFRYGNSQETPRVKIPYALIVFLSIICIYQIFMIIFMSYMKLINTYHFTYWNYMYSTFFDVAYILFCLGNCPVIFKCLNLIFFPIRFGCTALVCFLVVIILHSNDQILVSASTFGVGAYTLGVIHMADFLIHCFPLISCFFIMIMGQKDIVATFIYYFRNGQSHILDAEIATKFLYLVSVMPTTRSDGYDGDDYDDDDDDDEQALSHRHHSHTELLLYPNTYHKVIVDKGYSVIRDVVYSTYWIFSPGIFLIIYSILYNPFEIYPTNYTTLESFIIAIVVMVVLQSTIYISMLTSTVFGVKRRKRKN